jgi:ABC-type transport system involved in cytochrome bd biosynthesis fused ATPase/permease subunit
MRAFNPTAPAQTVIEAGLVSLDLHRSLYANLAGRADLEPGSQQLLVGGIGSGKTTELLLAVRWLQKQGNVLPLYIDITADTNLVNI